MERRKVADRARRLKTFARPLMSEPMNALMELASLFPFGELMLSTQPAEFLRMVGAEVERLRNAAGESAYPVPPADAESLRRTGGR